MENQSSISKGKSDNHSEPSNHGPTVVGIGASAGGLTALKVLLNHFPADANLAFVVVVHLSPNHESHLAELLQPHVSFPVQQVTETVPIEPNHVYVIPPNANIEAIDTHLRLSRLEEQRNQRAPIDHFFRTLSAIHDGNAVGVVLTGTGSDGTLGIKDIKARAGLVIVQDPNEAEYDGMPQSAIATGLVDQVLPLSAIPEAIVRFKRTEPKVAIPEDEEDIPPTERELLQRVFAQLRAQTDRDFTRYKRSTVLRRIARRMQLCYVEDLGLYLERLREQPEEARALADDLLITVTHFFRDPEVFEHLEKEIVPRLFGRTASDPSVRVWSVGCATGEEAYSLAMLLVEEASRRNHTGPIQVFASDLHRRSLEKAREGFYPGDIATDVSVERLNRFFQKEKGGFRIRKEIRDLVVFAPHNLLADPPFSRMDLISCRNLLIYLDRNIQRDVIELFHYALNPDGVLLLGSAESLEASDLFRTTDKRLCVFRKRNVPPPEPRLPVFPAARGKVSGEPSANGQPGAEPIAYGALHQRMVERFAPPSILISSDNKLAHLSQHAGRYLTHPGGEPTANIFRVLREELRAELQALVHKARHDLQPASSKPIPVKFDGHQSPVVMHVSPGSEQQQEGFVLILFEEREASSDQASQEAVAESSRGRIQELESDLYTYRQRLQTLIEEYETSQEEMKASNEELQSANEELRSTLEELETSKEELQSINEELHTVNQQNRHKVEELAQLSSDLQNLLSATDIATLFLDRSLRIMRFTPKLGDLFNIRAADRGRPISDLTHRLGYSDLLTDAGAVQNRLMPIEREVQDDRGRWYLARVLPYRSAEDRIDGVVITFIDIDRRKKIEEDLRLANHALLRANTDLKSFSYAASHDMQEPLRSISIHCELLIRVLQQGHYDTANEHAQHVRESAGKMRDLIHDLLAFTRLTDDEPEYPRKADAGGVVKRTLELLKSLIESNEAQVAYDGLPVIQGQDVFLIQLFQNLIENSIKYRGSEPPRIKISAERIGKMWQFAIQDNGAGIEPQYQQQIFTIFQRLHGDDIPGTGMGLAIAQRVVEREGGRIWVESIVGKGSTFYFTLPALDDASEATA